MKNIELITFEYSSTLEYECMLDAIASISYPLWQYIVYHIRYHSSFYCGISIAIITHSINHKTQYETYTSKMLVVIWYYYQTAKRNRRYFWKNFFSLLIRRVKQFYFSQIPLAGTFSWTCATYLSPEDHFDCFPHFYLHTRIR